MPPIKEIHYLDHGQASSLRFRLFSNAGRARRARSYLIRQIRALPARGKADDLRWAARFCLAPRTDAWYASLFPDVPGKLAGEICPGYAQMREDEISRVHVLMPDAKIIYLLRNPIDRGWSHARRHFTNPKWKGRYGTLEAVPEAELRAFLARDATGHSDYLSALNRWEKVYGADRLFIGFFDELQAAPKSLLRRILCFLRVDHSDHAIPATVNVQRNHARTAAVPIKLRAYLGELHHAQLVELHARFDNAWTSSWLGASEPLEAVSTE